MVIDTHRLRAQIFEISGIAIDERDPIMAVLIASAHQADEIGARLLGRVNPVRVAITVSIVAALFAAAGFGLGWALAPQRYGSDQAEWVTERHDLCLLELLVSDQGKAVVRLAQLGVTATLVKCNGRGSWGGVDGFCILLTKKGQTDSELD